MTAQSVKNFTDYKERLKPVIKEYVQTQDLTVTDILIRSLEGAGPDTLRQEEAYGQGGPESEEAEPPRNEFGTLFHKLMEIIVTERPKTLSNRLFQSRFLNGLSRAQKREIKQSALNFWKAPLGQEVRTAKRCYAELPFIYKTKHGVLKGQIDLVFQNRRGAWMIVDYKTNRITAEQKESLAKQYEIQLGLYAMIFSKLYGEIPAKAVLYFSSLNETHEFSYDRDCFIRLAETVEAYFRRPALAF